MKNLGLIGKWAVAVFATVVAAGQLNANVVFYNTAPNDPLAGNETANTWILGMDFKVNTAGFVTAMGAFDNNKDGFGGNTIWVAIYNASTGVQVPGTATSFTGTTAPLAIGNYRLQNITPVTLAVGVYTIVAANYGASTEVSYNSWYNNPNPSKVSFNNNAGMLSMVQNVRFGSGTVLPTTLQFNALGQFAGQQMPGYGAGSFDFSPVPEPATYGAMAAGFLGLVCLVRRYQQKRKVAALA